MEFSQHKNGQKRTYAMVLERVSRVVVGSISLSSSTFFIVFLFHAKFDLGHVSIVYHSHSLIMSLIVRRG